MSVGVKVNVGVVVNVVEGVDSVSSGSPDSRTVDMI